MPIDMITDPDAAAAAVNARRELINAQAPCTTCGMALSACWERHGPGGAEYDPDFPGCCCYHGRHVVDGRALDTLLREVTTGSVRTVAEVLAVLNDRPHPATLGWLLDQAQWWKPRRGPMVRLTDMTDTHRFHLLGWLARSAPTIVEIEAGRILRGTSPDAFEPFDLLDEVARMRIDPLATVARTKLYGALLASLPREGSQEWQDLAERAEHHSTCPASRDLSLIRRCTERCFTDDGKYDPQSGKGIL